MKWDDLISILAKYKLKTWQKMKADESETQIEQQTLQKLVGLYDFLSLSMR